MDSVSCNHTHVITVYCIQCVRAQLHVLKKVEVTRYSKVTFLYKIKDRQTVRQTDILTSLKFNLINNNFWEIETTTAANLPEWNSVCSADAFILNLKYVTLCNSRSQTSKWLCSICSLFSFLSRIVMMSVTKRIKYEWHVGQIGKEQSGTTKCHTNH